MPAADAAGMMVSMIQSNYDGFGSGVVVPGTGISLQNRGTDFGATAGHPNLVAPRKRPYHTIVPGFPTREGVPVMSFDDHNPFGSCQAVWSLPDGYLGASDPRRDGQASLSSADPA